MPRTQWLYKYSAQNTIVVSRTFYTQEINEAFEELEEGNEDAMKNEFDRQVQIHSHFSMPQDYSKAIPYT